MKCSINGCDGEHVAKGLCGKHYIRRYRKPDPRKKPPSDHYPQLMRVSVKGWGVRV